jgi:integration host factor subunit beta
MNKLDVIETLKNENGLSKTEAKAVVDMFCDEIGNALANGDRVEIRGLCSFIVKKYKAYTGRNPKTGKKIKIKPKKLAFFKCGKELKERVDL